MTEDCKLAESISHQSTVNEDEYSEGYEEKTWTQFSSKTGVTSKDRLTDCSSSRNGMLNAQNGCEEPTIRRRHTSKTGFSDESQIAQGSNQKMDHLMADATLNEVCHKATSALNEIQERYNQEFKSLIQSVAVMAVNSQQKYDGSVADGINFSYAKSSGKKLTRKIFSVRESVLSELLKINHIRTVYNIFAAILIIFSIQTVIFDLMEVGSIRIDFQLISYAFGNFPMVITIWGVMKLFTLAVFPVFNLWRNMRLSSVGMIGYIDCAGLVMYITFVLGFLYFSAKAVFQYSLPPGSTLVVICEQIRMLMKVHAYVRENVPHVLQSKDNKWQPSFSKYLYFLFVPTLIYRDEYPRTERINWSFVTGNLMQLVICIFYTYYIFIRFCVPNFQNFNSDHVSFKVFIMSWFGSMMPGTLVLFIGFFAVLHLWMNAWAEMLRFGDRLFYKDWWNSTSFASYYRNWNIVVHDWLYSYVYQDTYMLYGFKHKWFAMHLTFLMSAIVHEYIMIMAFRFFYPILFFEFGIFGVFIIYLLNGSYERPSNIIIWVLLLMGTGLLMCCYSMEWYARINCPPVLDTFVDYFVPRFWFCDNQLMPKP